MTAWEATQVAAAGEIQKNLWTADKNLFLKSRNI